jgi:tripartite-type tricarboxylate transporter receptor subunit TctC
VQDRSISCWCRFVSLLIAAVAALAASPADAQSVAEFYKGKTVTLIVSSAPGGGYDALSRTVAPHLSRHIPGNPTVVVRNMSGAGGIVAVNHLFNVAAKDGTVIGNVQNNTPFEPLFGTKEAMYDPLKFNWLGTPSIETAILTVWHQAPVTTWKDVLTKEITMGSSGVNSTPSFYGRLLAETLGLKLKLIVGYESQSRVFLAMERGEVDGICESLDSINQRKPEWIPNKTVNVLLQAGAESRPELAGVPNVMTLARNDEEKQVLEYLYAGQDIGRPFVAPPDLPPQRLKMLRDAFSATMKDSDFAADVKRNKFDLEPEDGEHLAALINRIYATPKAIIDRVSNLIK